MTEYEECEKCGYKYPAIYNNRPCLYKWNELMTAQFGYTLEEILHDLYYYGEGYCENDDKCEQCRHWDSGECALYDEILEEFEWEYEEEYGEEYEG